MHWIRQYFYWNCWNSIFLQPFEKLLHNLNYMMLSLKISVLYFSICQSNKKFVFHRSYRFIEGLLVTFLNWKGVNGLMTLAFIYLMMKKTYIIKLYKTGKSYMQEKWLIQMHPYNIARKNSHKIRDYLCSAMKEISKSF